MSLSIGIGVEKWNDIFFGKVKEISIQSGYEVSLGISSFDGDVAEGVEALARCKKWEMLIALRAPATANANLAFGVYKELVDFECVGIRPKFFDFCHDIWEATRDFGVDRLGIFFATEWHGNDRIRMSSGDVGRLINILSLPGHCMIRTINVETCRCEDWDEVPFYYDMKRDNNSE